MAELVDTPVTRTPVSAERARAIRSAVQAASSMATDNEVSRLATTDDAAVFYDFLKDPEVHAPIYTLPTVLTLASVTAFIQRYSDARDAGTGLLFFNFNRDGALGGYTDVTVWPDWAAGELGGAVHPNRQGQRKGIAGARLGFSWMFDALDLDVICETAALDNIRTARLLDTLGFRRMGQTLSSYDDGRTRPSLVWEVTKDEWRAMDKTPATQR